MSAEFLDRLKAAAVPLERIETKELGTVYMRRQTGEDRWRLLMLQDELLKAGKKRIPPAAIVAVSLIKEDGSPQFGEDLAEGFALLNAIGGDVLEELYNKALAITGLGHRALENAEKKSSSSQSSESGTSSPASSEAEQ